MNHPFYPFWRANQNHFLSMSLEELYGDRLIHLILYGSHARNQATEASDIDIMVVLNWQSALVSAIQAVTTIDSLLN